jgi:hypothetical protein
MAIETTYSKEVLFDGSAELATIGCGDSAQMEMAL